MPFVVGCLVAGAVEFPGWIVASPSEAGFFGVVGNWITGAFAGNGFATVTGTV